jgi:hypothetical protein
LRQWAEQEWVDFPRHEGNRPPVARACVPFARYIDFGILERAKGFEPSTLTLATGKTSKLSRFIKVRPKAKRGTP